ncbi:hypothetical protein D0T50_03575 [Bacteroides sp. 214]|nr:hypothetical protein [Bacteroides sp. 214]
MDNPMYLSEPFTRTQAWIDLLLLANHKQGYFYVRGNKVIVERGQLGTSSRTLASRWQWSRGKVERFLVELEKEGQIKPQKNNVTSLITICNYEEYQKTEPQNKPQTDRKQSTEKPQTDPNNKGNKNNNENNNSYSYKNMSENDFSDDFDSSFENIENDDLSNGFGSSEPSTHEYQESLPRGKKEGKNIDFKAIIELYHTNCPSYPRIIKLSDTRKQKIRIRLEEMKFDLALLENIFKSMEKSKFLRGDNKNGWKATFDWVFENPKNWVKIAEGNYNDKAPAGGSPKSVNDIWDE